MAPMNDSSVTETLRLGPEAAGSLLSPAEFDAAEFKEGWRYELIHGVLVVTPPPGRRERDPNEELGHWLRQYQEQHPEGANLDLTISEETLHTATERRRADRAIWAGLGRLPEEGEPPTLVVELVSPGRQDRHRDSVGKRDTYLDAGVREYWIVDPKERAMTVHPRQEGDWHTRRIGTEATYTTRFLPGFVLPVGRLLSLAARWSARSE